VSAAPSDAASDAVSVLSTVVSPSSALAVEKSTPDASDSVIAAESTNDKAFLKLFLIKNTSFYL
jgi:hypothetical protein